MPNSCTKCHAGKSSAWAAHWALKWYPNLASRPAPLATEGSSVARASALVQAVAEGRADAMQQVTALLSDSDPLVRKTAVDALAGGPPDVRAQLLQPLLGDAVKGVRIAAARWLAGVPTAGWSAQDQAALKTATDEYIAVQRFNADRPEALSNLGLLHADQHDWTGAEALLKQAMAMETGAPASKLNLADVYREQGREAEAQALIRQVIGQHPKNAAAQHALGLSLIRQRQFAQALQPLQKAVQMEPGNLRYATIYQLAQERR
jgi:tetratricopeptide (TPR) repeat protein